MVRSNSGISPPLMISISGESLVVINAIKLVDYFHGHSLGASYDVLPRHH
jgi:hypothetical protein